MSVMVVSRSSLSDAGSATFWLRSRSPNAAFNCDGCSLAPDSSSLVATEPLQIAFDGSVPSSVVSAQVQPPLRAPTRMRHRSGALCPWFEASHAGHWGG